MFLCEYLIIVALLWYENGNCSLSITARPMLVLPCSTSLKEEFSSIRKTEHRGM